MNRPAHPTRPSQVNEIFSSKEWWHSPQAATIDWSGFKRPRLSFVFPIPHQRFHRYYNSSAKTLRIQNVGLCRRQGAARERRFLAQHSIYQRLEKRNSKQTVVVGILPREFRLLYSSMLRFHEVRSRIQFVSRKDDGGQSFQSTSGLLFSIPICSITVHSRNPFRRMPSVAFSIITSLLLEIHLLLFQNE